MITRKKSDKKLTVGLTLVLAGCFGEAGGLDDEALESAIASPQNSIAASNSGITTLDGSPIGTAASLKVEDYLDVAFASLLGPVLWLTDCDKDGYPPDDAEWQVSEEMPPDVGDCGWTRWGTAFDCDDTTPSTNPGAEELCDDGVDNNCNGVVDSDAPGIKWWYQDCDGDGFAQRNAVAVYACTPQPDRYCVWTDLEPRGPDEDCDDDAEAINPLADEIVGDGVDQNCDGKELCYRDVDNDGYRTEKTIESVDSDCFDEFEAALNLPAGDCCDSDDRAHPYANEWKEDATACRHYDFNCDGRVEQRWGPANPWYTCNKFDRCESADVGWIASPTPGCGESQAWANGCAGNWISCWWQQAQVLRQQCR